VRGLKIRGVYASQGEAVARSKQLQRNDTIHNVFVGEVGKWLPWDPNPNAVAEQEYAEDQLNTLMKKYKENETARDTFYSEQRQKGVKGMAGQQLKVERPEPEAADASAFTAGVGSYASMFSGPADLVMERKKEKRDEKDDKKD
jgi:hypothetical protein